MCTIYNRVNISVMHNVTDTAELYPDSIISESVNDNIRVSITRSLEPVVGYSYRNSLQFSVWDSVEEMLEKMRYND